jgi:HlyD family secretion protein
MARLGPVARKRLLFWSVPAALLAAALVWAFRTPPVPVDIAPVARGPFVVTVDEEGETRVHDVFTVSAPIAGRLLRTDLHVGDAVVAGETVVARIEPADPGLLDPRARLQAEHAVEAAQAAAQLARAERERARADEDFAAAEVVRIRELHAKGVVSKQAIDEAERAHRSAHAAHEAANAAINVREHELAVARAALITPTERTGAGTACACIDLHAPVTGDVLGIAEKSETVVQVGAPIVELGDPATIEIVADYLSTDAVALSAGQRAIVDGWGGPPLNAVVRRVEPAAFTKVSALGIEEQRVNVVLDLTDPREKWSTLGHAYRVDVHVVVWESESAVTVPLTALFRRDDAWALFVADDGVARLRAVEPGRRAGLDVEILEGVTEGEAVVLNPGDGVEDGTRIRARQRRG